MDTIEIKEANVKALRALQEQMQQLSMRYQGAIEALAVANDVPSNWQWDNDRMLFVAPAPPAAKKGNGKVEVPEMDETVRA